MGLQEENLLLLNAAFFQIGLFFLAFSGGLYTSTWNFGITLNKAKHYRLQATAKLLTSLP